MTIAPPELSLYQVIAIVGGSLIPFVIWLVRLESLANNNEANLKRIDDKLTGIKKFSDIRHERNITRIEKNEHDINENIYDIRSLKDVVNIHGLKEHYVSDTEFKTETRMKIKALEDAARQQ